MLLTQRDGAEPPAQDGRSLLLDRAERRALRLLALHQLALALGGQADAAQALDLILTQARSLLRAPAGSICLADPAGPGLIYTVAQQVPVGVLGRRIAPGEGAAGAAFQDCKTVLINSYQAWPGASAFGRSIGIEAAVSVPLRAGERVLGALSVHTSVPGQTFDEEDAWLLELLGDQAAMALEQARLVEQAERRAARLLALHRVSTAISAPADPGQTLALILSQAVLLLQRRCGAIYLWDEARERLVLVQVYGLDASAVDPSLQAGEGMAGWIWQSGKPLIVDNYQSWEHATPRGRRLGLVSVAAVPMAVNGRQLGSLWVAAENGDVPFSPEEVQFLELCSSQAAVAVENARLLEQAARARAMEELHRLKSEFISTVSHELRTPLTYIHGYSELLLRREFPGQTMKEAVAEIHGASFRMARLVDDLLDLSRLEAGRLGLQPEVLDLGELLQGAVAAMRVQAPGLKVVLELERLPRLLGDADRLRQVVDNLLSNAQRYASTGEILLRAYLADDAVRVDVVDQGPGIAVEDRERIFEPFYRGARSEVLSQRGGGLGLSIVRRLIEAHGGQVGLECGPGRGSTFWFTLPLTGEREPARPTD